MRRLKRAAAQRWHRSRSSATRASQRERKGTLFEIVDAMNVRFRGELAAADFVSLRQIGEELDEDEDMRSLFRKNPPDVARGP